MIKRFVSLLLCLLMLMPAGAGAQQAPSITLTVTDTGEQSPDPDRPYVLQVLAASGDGSFSQTVSWLSAESAQFGGAVPLARMKDLNFDGYQDLLLLTAEGAQNVFFAFSLWDVQAGQFRPAYQDCEWLREESRFSDEIKQVELCNPELFPEKRMLLSDEQDGYRFSREIFYMWDGSYYLTPKYIWDVYDAGDGMIGEAMTQFMTRVTFLWDEQYPESWYHEQEGVSSERRESAHRIALSAHTDMERARVANADWVNLRRQDSKSSPSLARIDAGENVTVLADACGQEDGWVRVLYDLGEHHALTMEEYDTGRYTLTGYIWHSFLEPVNE
ncbi:MAG: hypothetical protein IKK75_05875 [Clostridia bacterium]|nr:hypothetical protein [Clostridia bacterium]